jgi:hypothetical protein
LTRPVHDYAQTKVTDEGYAVMGPISDPVVRFEFAKGLHLPETSTVAQGGLHRLETSEKTERRSFSGEFTLSSSAFGALQVLRSSLG